MENIGEIATFVADAYRLGICIAVGGIRAPEVGITRKVFCVRSLAESLWSRFANHSVRQPSSRADSNCMLSIVYTSL
jgi:hypothetical protein